MGSLRLLAFTAVTWCCCTVPARAQAPATEVAPSREQCLAQHEQAQDSRLAGKLLAARSALRECSAAACPALVSRDCVAWLGDVERQIPSVIFRAAKDGADVVSLRVSEDQQLLTDSLTGTPLELDPGPHRFVAELPGFASQTATYVLQAGDKARVVRFDFTTPRPAPLAPAASPPPAPPPPLWRPVPTITYVLAGATLTATVVGSVLGSLALNQRNNVEHDCAPLCTDAEVSHIRNLAVAADVSLAVALLGAGATIYSYTARPSVPMPSATGQAPRELHLALRGLGLQAGGSF